MKFTQADKNYWISDIELTMDNPLFSISKDGKDVRLMIWDSENLVGSIALSSYKEAKSFAEMLPFDSLDIAKIIEKANELQQGREYYIAQIKKVLAIESGHASIKLLNNGTQSNYLSLNAQSASILIKELKSKFNL